MSGHVGNLDQNQQEILNEFREKVANILSQDQVHDDYFLLRWLRARDFDIQKSEQMIKQNCRFRKEWKIHQLLEEGLPELWRNYYPGGYIGQDKEGSPLFLLNIGRFDVKGMYSSMRPEQITKCSLALSEKGMQLCEEQSKLLGRRIEGVTVIEDLAGFSMAGFYKPAMGHFTKVMQLFEDNYPEFMKHVFIVNAPRIFYIIFAMVKPFLSQKTKEKMRVLGSNYKEILQQYIDIDNIPQALGGDLVDKDGDPNCLAVTGHGGEIPTSYYLSELTKENDRPLEDYCTVVVARADTLKLDYDISVPGTLLKWEFKTDYHNIAFGVIKVIENEDGTVEYYEVIPVMRRNSQATLEEGSYFCEDAGKYILQFDNTFSWINSKSLHYIVEVLPPDETVTDDLGDKA